MVGDSVDPQQVSVCKCGASCVYPAVQTLSKIKKETVRIRFSRQNGPNEPNMPVLTPQATPDHGWGLC